jgi:hypothetical protein
MTLQARPRRPWDLRIDYGFQDNAAELVRSGTITRHSFVLSITGHDIPIAARLLAPDLGLDTSADFALAPEDLDEVAPQRLQSQAAAFSQAFPFPSAHAATSGAVLLGIDAHRVRPVDASRLPSAEQLRRAGLDRAVVLISAECFVYGCHSTS